jgi:antagonist of KipI
VTRQIAVRRSGVLLTVQDDGRPVGGRWGVSPSGPLDPLAFAVANRLVGNPEGTAALEVTGPGAEIEFLADTRWAVAGGDLLPRLDGEPMEGWRSHHAMTGAVLAFRGRRQGARAYLAVDGGIVVDKVLGSAASDLDGGLGDGPLVAGRRLPLGCACPGPLRAVSPKLLASYTDPFTLRVVADADCPELALALASGSFTVGAQSNRTGFRLEGSPLPVHADPERLSEPVPPGAIQVPPNGQPILMMADRPTVGGYPIAAYLIAADQPKAGDRKSVV